MTDSQIRDLLLEKHAKRSATKPLYYVILALLLALVASNVAWYRAYHKLDLNEMQASALLDWSNSLLKSEACK